MKKYMQPKCILLNHTIIGIKIQHITSIPRYVGPISTKLYLIDYVTLTMTLMFLDIHICNLEYHTSHLV